MQNFAPTTPPTSSSSIAEPDPACDSKLREEIEAFENMMYQGYKTTGKCPVFRFSDREVYYKAFDITGINFQSSIVNVREQLALRDLEELFYGTPIGSHESIILARQMLRFGLDEKEFESLVLNDLFPILYLGVGHDYMGGLRLKWLINEVESLRESRYPWPKAILRHWSLQWLLGYPMKSHVLKAVSSIQACMREEREYMERR